MLILAVAVTYYAQVALNDVPRWGADAEYEWDESVREAMTRLARQAGANVGTHAPASVAVPTPPPPRTFDVPLIGRTEPLRPSGSVALESTCSFTGSHHHDHFASDHVHDHAPIIDFTGAGACMVFRSQPTYTPQFGYRVEHGALLRVQGDRAVILSGPPLDLQAPATAGECASDSKACWRVGLTLPALQGSALSASVDRTAASVDLNPRVHLTELSPRANAASVIWEFGTAHPEAWQDWFEAQFTAAGFEAVSLVCMADDATPAPVTGKLCPPDAEQNTVLVAICPDLKIDGFVNNAESIRECGETCIGPIGCNIHGTGRTTIRLALSYGVYDVTIR